MKAFVKSARDIIAQITPEPTDETKRAMPCPTRLLDMATIAKMKVAIKKMNPNPKIQKVRKPKIRHIQPALTADDFAAARLGPSSLPGSG